jgi:glycine cleavage system aminomethyltransferase T
LRLEKGYRLWGVELHTRYNPYEAGLGFAVRLKKGEFLGSKILTKIKEDGPKRKLCCLIFKDPTIAVLGKEPILDGEHVLGYVTSTNYGHTVRQSIVYAYLPLEYAREGQNVEVYFFGSRHRARVMKEPLYDPENLRLKSS